MAEKKEAKMNLEDTIKQIIKTYGEGAILSLIHISEPTRH